MKEYFRAVKIILIVSSIFLLVAVDWLAFHDIREPPTLRDGLMLLASLFVCLYFAIDIWTALRKKTHTPET